MTTKKNYKDILNNITDNFESLNKILTPINKIYKFNIKNVRQNIIPKAEYVKGEFKRFYNPDPINERMRIYLKNFDKIEEYITKNEINADISEIRDIIEAIKQATDSKSILEAEGNLTTEQQKTKQLEEQNKELLKDNEEKTQQKKQATEAFKGLKDNYHDELAEQKNINKNLQDKIDTYEQRFKELEKAPLKRNYIMDKVNNESYSLDKGELMNIIKNDVEKHILPEDTDIEQIADAIYAKATKRIYKNLRRINKLSVLSGYNPDLYNKLPAEVAEVVKNYMNDKINEDIRKKNIRYILPKEKPRWEKAMQKYNLNPMLGRGAYVI